MQEYYYELVVTPNSHYSLFCDFLSDILPVGFEESGDSFIVRSEESLETVVWGLEQFAEALSKATKQPVEVKCTEEKKQNSDWIAQYQKSVQPLSIGKFFIHPTWEEAKEGAFNIALDPALAFGTGHHPTTHTCIEAISTYVENGMEVCDVGCGSGILAIACSKLGGVVDACDTDIQSIDNAKENAKLNATNYRNIWQGSIADSNKKYDVIVANIVADVLVFLANDLKKHLKDEGSYLILSGILARYEKKVLAHYQDCILVERIAKEEWVSLVLQKKETN